MHSRSKVLFICCIAPSIQYLENTINALNYSSKIVESLSKKRSLNNVGKLLKGKKPKINFSQETKFDDENSSVKEVSKSKSTKGESKVFSLNKLNFNPQKTHEIYKEENPFQTNNFGKNVRLTENNNSVKILENNLVDFQKNNNNNGPIIKFKEKQKNTNDKLINLERNSKSMAKTLKKMMSSTVNLEGPYIEKILVETKSAYEHSIEDYRQRNKILENKLFDKAEEMECLKAELKSQLLEKEAEIAKLKGNLKSSREETKNLTQELEFTKENKNDKKAIKIIKENEIIDRNGKLQIQIDKLKGKLNKKSEELEKMQNLRLTDKKEVEMLK